MNAWHTIDIILKVRDQTVKNRGKIPSSTTGAYILVEKVVNMILGLNNGIWKNQLRGLVRKCNCEHVNKQRFEWHKRTKTFRKFRGRTSGADISLDFMEQSQAFRVTAFVLVYLLPWRWSKPDAVHGFSLLLLQFSWPLLTSGRVTENDKDSMFDFNHLFSTFPKNTVGIFPEFAIGLLMFVTWF